MKVLLCRLRPATCAVALACLLCAAGCEPQEKEIVIISLNDLHSHIDDLDKVAAYVAEQRRQHPNVLLLSAGDIFSGSPVVDAYPEKGYPIIDLMNNAHFDASTLGNHEFDYGQATLAKRIEQAEFPFVCANINAAGSPIPPLAPYAMFNLSGEKVCVVGLIQEHPETHRDRIKNLRFASPQAELERHAFLREKCSVLLALTHVGLREDSLLALRCGQIDLIVGGHSHTKLDSGLVVGGVLITQAERYVHYLAHTTLRLRRGRVVSKRNHLVEVALLTERDTLMSRKIKEYNSRKELQQVAATLETAITGRLDIGTFFCDALRSSLRVDIALQNLKGVRVDALPAGAITVGKLYEADPFGNEIIRFDMTEQELRQFIADNYLHFRRIDLCASGIRYTVAPTASGAAVSLTLPDGRPLTPGRRYSVAMNSYMATQPDEYKLPAGASGKGLGVTTVEVLLSYMEQQKNIRYRPQARAELLHAK